MVIFAYETQPTKSRLVNQYAGMSLAYPRARYRLPWFQFVLAGIQNASITVHSVPMLWPAAVLLAMTISQAGLLYTGF